MVPARKLTNSPFSLVSLSFWAPGDFVEKWLSFHGYPLPHAQIFGPRSIEHLVCRQHPKMEKPFREHSEKIQQGPLNSSIHGGHGSRPSSRPTLPIGGGPVVWILVVRPPDRSEKTGGILLWVLGTPVYCGFWVLLSNRANQRASCLSRGTIHRRWSGGLDPRSSPTTAY